MFSKGNFDKLFKFDMKVRTHFKQLGKKYSIKKYANDFYCLSTHIDLAQALLALKNAKILNEDTFEKIIIEFSLCRRPSHILSSDLTLLQKNKFLSIDIFNILIDKLATCIYSGLQVLADNKILCEENIIAMLNNKSDDAIFGMSEVIFVLQNSEILKDRDFFKYLSTMSNPAELALAISSVNRIFTLRAASKITELLAPDVAFLWSQTKIRIFSQIPDHLMTNDNYLIIIAAARLNTIEALINARDQILAQDARVRNPKDLNYSQSTHNKFVHLSVSKSALKLKNRYFENLNVDSTIKEIKKYIRSLKGNEAVKNCVEKITSTSLNYIDKDSQLSIRGILAIAWKAIHDEKCLVIGHSQDVYAAMKEEEKNTIINDIKKQAKEAFIAALYEIQRGYNLDKNGYETNPKDADRPICADGTFNKIVEKLNGIHQDVEIRFLTKELASITIQSVAKTQARKFLTEGNSPKSYHLKKILLGLTDRDDGAIESIVPFIKKEVEKIMWNDFAELYNNDKNNSEWLSTLASIKSINFSKDEITQLRNLLSKNFAHAEETEKISIVNHSVFTVPINVEYIANNSTLAIFS